MSSVKDRVSAEEWATRVDLAAAYRLVARFGWDDLVFTHISARVPGRTELFLINPFGLLFDEITASSLVKVDSECNKIEESPFEVNPFGFAIHRAVHAVRHDAACVLHTHTTNGIAVSAQSAGLLPLSQHSIWIRGRLAYRDYAVPELHDPEASRLVVALGRRVHLILRNHGLLTVGATVAEAFTRMYYLERSCDIQIRAQSSGGALRHIGDEVLSAAQEVTMAGGAPLSRAAQRVWP